MIMALVTGLLGGLLCLAAWLAREGTRGKEGRE